MTIIPTKFEAPYTNQITFTERQQIHFTGAADELPVKSHFVKRSVLTELGKEFKFDFPAAVAMESLDITETPESSNGIENGDEKHSADKTANVLPVIPSTNSFRFNFAIETD